MASPQAPRAPAPTPGSVTALGRQLAAASLDGPNAANTPDVSACVPKEETRASAFLAARPTCDGRGVLVGILDTGVDPGSAGLQTTTDGRPKIVDIVDCTGSGDVDLAVEKEVAQGEGGLEVVGLSGRTLRLNAAWFPGSAGKLRLGVKHAFDIYPKALVRRLQRERREAFDLDQAAAVAELSRRVAAAKEEKGTDAKASADDLELQLAELQAYASKYEDCGPVFDCVAFQNGEGRWYGAVDTSETGDLREARAMTDFDVDREWQAFSDQDALNYGLHFYDDGRTLSIVNDVGAHGTHVAAITAAHHPDAPLLNGVAPGAQIVSLRIGDSRLGSMETGTGVIRALLEAKKHGCHILNMSYGEAGAVTNRGYFADLANELVRNHGVILVGSAGNNGPALTTVGCPGGTTDGYISVGAYVSPRMSAMQYSMLATGTAETETADPAVAADGVEVPVADVGQNYTWSSVGPAPDGDTGVSLCAPGGAITSVPLWTQQRSKLMNGTSMSSPNACGNVALLLSAAQQQNILATPARVRRALEATAKTLDGVHPLKQGHGLLQVDAAVAYLTAHAGVALEAFGFRVSVSGAGDGHNGVAPGMRARGIYLRQPGSVARVQRATVEVVPVFQDKAPTEERVRFEVLAGLVASAPWVACPDTVVLLHGGNSFAVEVDPTGLGPGVHTAMVRGMDLSAAPAPDAGATETPPRGPLFEVPVTVIVPHNKTGPAAPAAWDYQIHLRLRAGVLNRCFLEPPEGATWAEVTVSRTDSEVEAAAAGDAGPGDNANRLVVLHALQILPQLPYREAEVQTYLRLQRNSRRVTKIRVEPGHVLELDIGQYWSSQGDTPLEVQVRFRGVTPMLTAPALLAGSAFASLEVQHAALCPRHERLKPAGSFSTLRRTLSPKTAAMLPGGERDVLLDEVRIMHNLVLSYELKMAAAGTVRLRWSALNDELYESPFGSQIFVVFDANKKSCGSGDAWSDKLSLGKGLFTVQLRVRHDDVAVLKALETMPLVVLQDLTRNKVSLEFYGSREEAVKGGSKMGATVLHPGMRQRFWLREPPKSALPKAAKDGQGVALLGSVTFTEDLDGGAKRPKGSRDQVAGWPVTYHVDPAAIVAPAAEASPAKWTPEISAADAYATAVREAAVKHLKGLAGKPAFDEVHAAAVQAYGTHVTLQVARMEHCESRAKKDADNAAAWEATMAACDEVVAAIDTTALAQHLGMRTDLDDAEAKYHHQEFEKKKDTLIAALRARAGAARELSKLRVGDEAAKEGFLDACKALAQWADPKELKYADLAVHKHRLQGRCGEALKALSQVAGNDDAKVCRALSAADAKKLRAELCEELGWHHVAAREKLLAIVAAPANFATL